MPGAPVEEDMAFDETEVARWTRPDVQQRRRWREAWLALMDLCLWGELRSTQIGTLSRLRKRVLDLGEKLRSYVGDRQWIPHPRERIKNCLSSGLQLREALGKVTESLEQLDGGADLAQLQTMWDTFSSSLLDDLGPREEALVALLNQQYAEDV